MQQISYLMSDPNAMKEEIGSAGIRLFVHLYGGKQTDSLNSLMYAKFMEMVSCGKTLEPERLPSTERAAFFHITIKSFYGENFQTKSWILCNGIGNLMERY